MSDPTAKTTVLIVDDSPTARHAIRLALSQDPRIEVLGEAATGEAALRGIQKHDPALVTMDVFLRREDGIQVARQIMQTSPRPILAITIAGHGYPEIVYRASAAGVLEVVSKPPSPQHPLYRQRCDNLCRLVLTLAQVPVVHRWRRGARVADRATTTPPSPPPRPTDHPATRRKPHPAPARLSQVLIGASTGGPPVLAQLLRALPRPPPFRIIVAQHMADGFMADFASWLASESKLKVAMVDRPTRLTESHLFLPADECHLVFRSPLELAPDKQQGQDLLGPSIDPLFFSAASHGVSDTAAILLTGMGKDGTAGLKALHAAGAYTVAQEPATCVVDSMPRAAMAAEAVDAVLAPEEIATWLARS